MDPAEFQVLDRLTERNGPASAKDLDATNRKAKQLLTSLCESGLLVEKSKKYSLSEAGRKAWEESASPARHDAVRARRQEREEKELAGFLEAVRLKDGKKPAGKHREEVVRSAVEKNLVAAADKGAYRLLPAGRQFLLRTRPAEEQVAALQSSFREMTDRWEAVRQRLEQDLTRLTGSAEVAAEVHAKAEAARAGLDSALAEMGQMSRLLELGRRLKESAADASDTLRRQLSEETERRQALEGTIRTTLADHQHALDSFRRHFDERIAELTKKQLKGGSQEPPATEAAAWEATRRAYEHMYSATRALGGIVKVPELADVVTREVAGLDAARFRELLMRWQDADRLVLQVCNDPALEPRAAEGIRSDRGLLFYVKLS